MQGSLPAWPCRHRKSHRTKAKIRDSHLQQDQGIGWCEEIKIFQCLAFGAHEVLFGLSDFHSVTKLCGSIPILGPELIAIEKWQTRFHHLKSAKKNSVVLMFLPSSKTLNLSFKPQLLIAREFVVTSAGLPHASAQWNIVVGCAASAADVIQI